LEVAAEGVPWQLRVLSIPVYVALMFAGAFLSLFVIAGASRIIAGD
jgi:hypothetical protein